MAFQNAVGSYAAMRANAFHRRRISGCHETLLSPSRLVEVISAPQPLIGLAVEPETKTPRIWTSGVSNLIGEVGVLRSRLTF